MCDPEFTYSTSEQACVRKPGGMRQPCVIKDQCYINGSVCFKEKCMCTPGLSYHKAEQACVKKCSTYGKTMSIYEGLAIAFHNNEEKHRYSPKSVSIDVQLPQTICV
ncbi:uncharacterized protein LOC124270421 [Haliotis rubra]|uniref:uncharacterized protein LOC124270421 n=1 Tax=Haliotis rubra TaxID=36100 RepID=UPI001EE4EE53|nr:uncharacterized protein LOC124270421 [Haliotis rubra]